MKRTLALWVGIAILVGATASASMAWPPFWGWGWRSPVIVGTVTAVNAQNSTLTLQTTIGWFPTTVTLTVDPSAQIIRHFSTPLSGLKVGDQVEVAGLPLAIQADRLRASTPPAPAPTGETGGTPSTTEGTTTSAQLGARAHARGTVKSVDVEKKQVVVTLADGKTEVTVTVPEDLKVERRDVVKLSDVQVGDRARARVTLKGIGQVVAVALEVWESPPVEVAPPAGGTTTSGGAAG